MKTYIVKPFEAIGPVCLGMSRSAVRQVMGLPSAVRDAHEKWGIHFSDKDYFIENAFQVEYSSEGIACFIEVSEHESYRVEYLGLDVHRDEPAKVILALEKIAEPLRSDSEYPCNQFFPDIGVSIYREHSEEDHIDAFGVAAMSYRQ